MSTVGATFAEDLDAYADAGIEGMGIWEMKLDDESLDRFRASGLGAASAVPVIPSIHPLPLLPGPDDPRERIDSLLRSLHALAPFEPTAVVCLTGPGDRETVVAGLREVAGEAERLGLRLALEPFQREGIESWSIVNTLGEAAALVELFLGTDFSGEPRHARRLAMVTEFEQTGAVPTPTLPQLSELPHPELS